MDSKQETIERIIDRVLTQQIMQTLSAGGENSRSPQTLQTVHPGVLAQAAALRVPVGISNRHVHLSRTDMDTLFGPGSVLRRKKAMKQPGQFAAEETVTLKGAKGVLNKVRVLGPLRAETQVEISIADGFVLGIKPPLRLSGQLDDTPGIEIVGPQGSVQIEQGVIAAMRHIHLSSETAVQFGLRNGEVVDVEVGGQRGGVLRHVAIRATENSVSEMHVDVEEANAFSLQNDDLVRLCQ
jgi:putative phosphotransacetylase